MASELDYSTTASDNTNVNGVGISGLDLPRNLDDAIRQTMANAASSQPRANLKAGNYTAVKDDFGKTFVFSGAGRTLTISDISTLATGWNIYVEADAANALTIARSGTNTLNGATSISLEKGRRCRVFVSNSASDLKVDFEAKFPPGGVSNATAAGETNFPVGHTILVATGPYPASFGPNRNAVLTPRLGSSSWNYETLGSGTLLPGVWRSRGAWGGLEGNAYLVICEKVSD